MYRLGGMTTSGGATVVNGVSYNPANQLLTMTYPGGNETRSYNVLGQLTLIWTPGAENMQYTYPTGTNNGKVSSVYNVVSGDTVQYTYDSLNRMATAAGTGWGESYTFDGFGNLTAKTVTSGSGPSLSVSVNQSTNQIQGYGFSYDTNGNGLFNNATAYDVENRVSGVGWNNTAAPAVNYAYDAQNKRIWSWADTFDSLGNTTSYTVNYYSASGQKLGTYLFVPGQTYPQNGQYAPIIQVTLGASDQYFGGRRLAVMDQLGSAGTYYPWGEAKGGTNPQDTWSYATYWRDSATGLDYANNRYYSNAYGRFMTPDPSRKSADRRNPQSWNRYSYVLNDPVNANDPTGLCWIGNEWFDDGQAPCPDVTSVTVSDDPTELEFIYDNYDEIQNLAADINALDPQGFIDNFMVLASATGVALAPALVEATTIAAQAFELGANSIVLGPQGYVEIGGALGANTLSMSTAQWEALGQAGQQQAMEGFIDMALTFGKQIVFTIDPATAAEAGNLGTAFEYDYITSLGYQVVQQGTSWVVVVP